MGRLIFFQLPIGWFYHFRWAFQLLVDLTETPHVTELSMDRRRSRGLEHDWNHPKPIGLGLE